MGGCHDLAMSEPTWADQLSAWSTFATATLTLVLVLVAVVAWRAAKQTLIASREASTAAKASAEAARKANEQAKLDSIEQTRPYVYAEVIPGLAGTSTYDIRIVNVGKSAARQMKLEYDRWPQKPDDVASSLQQLFETPRTLPPGCSIRAYWRLDGPFTDGTNEAGLGKDGKVSVSYTSDDPSQTKYTDTFDVMVEKSGLWPVGEEGPAADGLKGDSRKFYLLGQALVRRVAELNR